jgi:hypothetical protein
MIIPKIIVEYAASNDPKVVSPVVPKDKINKNTLVSMKALYTLEYQFNIYNNDK